MTTFTDKELIKEIKERIGSLDVRDNIERRAYEIALASLEAEPVAYIFKHPAGKLFWALTDESNKEQPDVIPVYADSPAPVVPDEIDVNDVPRAVTYFKKHRDCYADGWNACRAAMLHGAEPASNHEELPLDYLQGQKDGLEWAAQLAEANHPQTGDWLYDDPLELAKAIRKGPDMPEFDGPTPVTLDGWISCSERMPENIPGSCKEYLVFDGLNNKVHHDYWVVPDGDSAPVASFWNHYGAHVTHWMPLPEPPKEVNRG